MIHIALHRGGFCFSSDVNMHIDGDCLHLRGKQGCFLRGTDLRLSPVRGIRTRRQGRTILVHWGAAGLSIEHEATGLIAMLQPGQTADIEWTELSHDVRLLFFRADDWVIQSTTEYESHTVSWAKATMSGWCYLNNLRQQLLASPGAETLCIHPQEEALQISIGNRSAHTLFPDRTVYLPWPVVVQEVGHAAV